VIAVLDYGIGNLRSAQKHWNTSAHKQNSSATQIARFLADGVVLPGVGAFGACAKALRASGLDLVAKEALSANRPFLAVCVGFQLLFEGSEEDPGVPGLGIFDGVVRRLSGAVKLPQIQWNELDRCGDLDPGMLRGLGERPWFYFVHSYAPVPGESSAEFVVAHCDYGGQVVARCNGTICGGRSSTPRNPRPLVYSCSPISSRDARTNR